VLERTLGPDRLYVMNRGQAKFSLFDPIEAMAAAILDACGIAVHPRFWKRDRWRTPIARQAS
jgi:hypothetical protein